MPETLSACLRGVILAGVLLLGSGSAELLAQAPPADADPQHLVAAAFEYLRGAASISTVTMIVHRPSWERRLTIEAWTRGKTESLFRITAPAKDRGNSTLKVGREMWTYNPKINRVIKLTPLVNFSAPASKTSKTLKAFSNPGSYGTSRIHGA